VREVAGGSTPSTPFVQPQRLMAAGRCSGRGAALGAARSPADMGPFALLCRNVRCQPAEDHQALDVAHGVPPPRAAPPVLRRVVLSDTRCPSGVPVSWSYSCGGARVRASALPAVVRCSSQEYKNLGQPRQKTQMIVASSLPFLLLLFCFPLNFHLHPTPPFPLQLLSFSFPHICHLLWLSMFPPHLLPIVLLYSIASNPVTHPLRLKPNFLNHGSPPSRPPLLLSTIMLLLSLISVSSFFPYLSCLLLPDSLLPFSFLFLSPHYPSLSLPPLLSPHTLVDIFIIRIIAHG
jgi:hypothetical protein